MNQKVLSYILVILFLMINGILLSMVLLEVNDYYEVKNNPSTQSIVKIKNKVIPKIEESSHKYNIYFTSDDGPVRGSKYLNDIILRQEVPMTLFLVGARVPKNVETSKRMMAYRDNKYVMIANHSYTHASSKYKKFYSNSTTVVNDFLKNEYLLDIDSRIGRLPGRNVWAANNLYYGKGKAVKSAKILEQKFEYNIYGWDYEIRHNKKGKVINSARTAYNRIKLLLKNNKTYVQDNIVILMHDQMFRIKRSRKFLEKLIILFKNDKDCQLKFMNTFPNYRL